MTSLVQVSGLIQVSGHFEALGFTLLHFCWQGTAIAALYKLFDLASPRLRSQTRYLVALGALMAMFAVFAATLTYEELRLSAASGAVADTVLNRVASASGMTRYLPWIDAAWMLGVAGLSLRMLGGLWLIHRLRDAAIAVPEAIAARFDAALRRAGLTGRVTLRLHLKITGPFVVGAFKSIVYLPLSAVTALGVDQLDAVLAHELEHIRRADYLWNLVQSLVETLLFFHPAVWWLGAKLREQRELCCDDAALSTCRDPLTYATALLNLEEQRRRPVLAQNLKMALNGQDGGRGLVSRIARMLGDREAMPRGKARPHMALALPVILLVVAAFLTPAAQVAAGNPQKPVTLTDENGKIFVIRDDPAAMNVHGRADLHKARAEILRADLAGINPQAIAAEASAEAMKARADAADMKDMDADAIAAQARAGAMQAKAELARARADDMNPEILAALEKAKIAEIDPDAIYAQVRDSLMQAKAQMRDAKDIAAGLAMTQKDYLKHQGRPLRIIQMTDAQAEATGPETPAPLADDNAADVSVQPMQPAPPAPVIAPPSPAAPRPAPPRPAAPHPLPPVPAAPAPAPPAPAIHVQTSYSLRTAVNIATPVRKITLVNVPFVKIRPHFVFSPVIVKIKVDLKDVAVTPDPQPQAATL